MTEDLSSETTEEEVQKMEAKLHSNGNREIYVEASDAMSLTRKSIDRELECPICIKLLYKPVSTVCGHTFCQVCLEEALEHKAHCPMCREAINGAASCHENRLVQSLIAKQYPEETRMREQEIENSRVANDAFARARRRDQTQAFVQKHRTRLAESAGTTSRADPPAAKEAAKSQDREEGHDIDLLAPEKWEPIEVPVIYQNCKYELPFPSDYVELYFEAPMYLDMVVDVMTCAYPGFVITLENPPQTQRGGDFSPDMGEKGFASVSSEEQSGNDSALPLDRSADTIVGVMVDIQQCLTFSDQLRFPTDPPSDADRLSSPEILSNTTQLSSRTIASVESERGTQATLRSRSTLRTLFTSVGSPPNQRHSRVSSWVPRRLYQHRLKITGNRRDMWQELPESNLFPEGCCVIRGGCAFRTLIDKSNMRHGPKGYFTAPILPCFDAPLSYGLSCDPGFASHNLAESLARTVHGKINGQLAGVGPAGKLLFQRKFGPPPPILPQPNSIYLEYWSLWALKVLQIPARQKVQLMSLCDTVVRLRSINQLLDKKQHLLALGLTSTTTEVFSWMLISGPISSLALGLGLFLFLVAASLWHRFGWDQALGDWPFYTT